MIRARYFANFVKTLFWMWTISVMVTPIQDAIAFSANFISIAFVATFPYASSVNAFEIDRWTIFIEFTLSVDAFIFKA